MPSASVSTAASVKPGARANARADSRRSCHSSSTPGSRRSFRIATPWPSVLPNATSARRRASSGSRPRRRFSSTCISMWKRNSSTIRSSAARLNSRLRSRARTPWIQLIRMLSDDVCGPMTSGGPSPSPRRTAAARSKRRGTKPMASRLRACARTLPT